MTIFVVRTYSFERLVCFAGEGGAGGGGDAVGGVGDDAVGEHIH